jgi:hypothetical protein
VVVVSAPLVWLVTHEAPAYADCLRRHGAAASRAINGVQGPCTTPKLILGGAYVGLFTVVILTTVVGLAVGVVEGRRRRRFAHARWVSMAVLGLAAPWTLVTYAAAYGLGRLLPEPAVPVPEIDPVRRQAWEDAVRLYAALAGGQPPIPVPAPGFLGGGPVYLDAPLRYSRYYGVNVRYDGTTTFAVGSPGFVAGAVIGSALTNRAGRARAAQLSQTQWRDGRTVRVLVTDSSTWCRVDGRWQEFAHASVVEYTATAMACVLAFPDVEPLMLAGPSAWCHAVLFGYFRYGPERWQDSPFLAPMRRAAAGTAESGPLPQ